MLDLANVILAIPIHIFQAYANDGRYLGLAVSQFALFADLFQNNEIITS